MAAVVDERELKHQLGDQLWRLNNLYWIVDKNGQRVKFSPNWAQERLLEDLRLRHLVLKARQLGMSTFINLLQLDTCLFTPNFTAVIIAHERGALEKLFDHHVKYPYDNLPEGLRNEVAATRDSKYELKFSNGSDISVALSTRSGTVQFLHVSEFGKICAKYPLKAQEIVTGAFESVPANGLIAIESTAEGQYGYFYDYCQEALNAQREGRKLAKHDWGITFLPWWLHPEYVARPRSVIITAPLRKYFEELEGKIGQKLGPARRAWYAMKWKTLGDKMKREYPSTPEEAFEQAIEGAYYAEQMAEMRTEGRICSVPHQTGVRVNTWWDLGVDDATAIWFVQEVGRETHVIDYYETSGEGLAHFAKVLDEKQDERKFLYGEHIAPHDIKAREWGNDGKSRLDVAATLGIRFTVCPLHEVADGIEACRNRLDRTWIDAERCDQGIKCLDSYQKEWDEVRGTWKRTPLHNWASHGADAFRTGVMGEGRNVRPTAKAVTHSRRWAV